MARLNTITYEQARENIRKNYDAIESKFKMIPNIFKGMANSPLALEAFLKLDESIENGHFSPVEQGIIGLVVSEYNYCSYCITAHSMALLQLGLKDEEIRNVRRKIPEDPKQRLLVQFTLKVIEKKGAVSDEDMAAFKKMDYTDAHVAELTLIIARNTLSNYFNHLNKTDPDLSEVSHDVT